MYNVYEHRFYKINLNWKQKLFTCFSEYYLYKLEDIAKDMCILTFNLQLILFSIYLQSKYILIILIIYAW